MAAIASVCSNAFCTVTGENEQSRDNGRPIPSDAGKCRHRPAAGDGGIYGVIAYSASQRRREVGFASRTSFSSIPATPKTLCKVDERTPGPAVRASDRNIVAPKSVRLEQLVSVEGRDETIARRPRAAE